MPSSAITLILAFISVSQSAPSPGSPVSAFSAPPVTVHGPTFARMHLAPKRTTCNFAKLNKIASSFDLDEILSNEKEFDSGDEDNDVTTNVGKRRRNTKKDNKKLKMKEQLKKQKLEKQQSKRRQNSQTSSPAPHGTVQPGLNVILDHSDVDEESTVVRDLIHSIDFLAYDVPSSLNGKRIDAALVDLLNDSNGGSEDASASSVSFSRSQCGTLISNELVFIVPSENATEFQSAWLAHQTENMADGEVTAVPYSLMEQHSTPVQRKSHVLDQSSIIVYPSRRSLLSTSSSSALLSSMPPTEIIAQHIPLDILYEDEHMIVINKQAGMVVHPAAGNWDGTLVNALAYYLMNESPYGAGEFFTDDETEEVHSDDLDVSNRDVDVNQNDAVTNSISTLRPGIVHRLDKGTTGVLVVAKTSSALATLSEAFADRKVKKQYLAVAIGNPGEDQWINKPIGRHPQHRQRMRVVPDPSSSMSGRGQIRLTAPTVKQGRPALSHIHTVHCDGKLSVVQVKIATGRTHQIRVHLQDHGTPIYGDDVYGLSDWNKALSARRGVTRPLLHAQRLEINHPMTGETMAFEAPVADDMMGVIKAIWPAGEDIVL